MHLTLELGERLVIGGRTVRVSALDIKSIPAARDVLIALAKGDATTTYGGLKARADLPHAVNGLGRLLDLVAEDCRRRGEPPLDALVVTATTGDVGAQHPGDAASQRRALREYWRA